MRSQLVSDAAVPGANEDAAGVLGDVAVLLDGAGVPQEFRPGCRHSVAWYSHALAARLLTHAQDPGAELRDVLRAAIAGVRQLHGAQCDLAAGGPSATVVVVRRDVEDLEYLVLCDSSLLLEHRDGEVTRITDARIDAVVRSQQNPRAIEARRNAPGGFWVARHEPEAASHALCGRIAVDGLSAAHLVSDGFTRAVDLLGSCTERGLAHGLREDPDAVLEQLRAAERALPVVRRPRKLHDDATAITLMVTGR